MFYGCNNPSQGGLGPLRATMIFSSTNLDQTFRFKKLTALYQCYYRVNALLMQSFTAITGTNLVENTNKWLVKHKLNVKFIRIWP